MVVRGATKQARYEVAPVLFVPTASSCAFVHNMRKTCVSKCHSSGFHTRGCTSPHRRRCVTASNNDPREEKKLSHKRRSDEKAAALVEQRTGPPASAEVGFALTAVVTAFSGGPILAIWGGIFLTVGRVTEAPFWLWSLATLICGGLTDALVWNATDFGGDKGIVPYVVLVAGTGISAVLDFDMFFGVESPPVSASMEEDEGKVVDSDVLGGDEAAEVARVRDLKRIAGELTEWDKALEKEADDGEAEI